MRHPLSAILYLLILAGCARDREVPPEARMFTDDLGRSVEVAQPVRRVVPLAPSLTELVYAAGAGDRLAAVSQADNFPPSVDTLPRFSSFPLDVEAVAALRPDLLLATDQVNSPADAQVFADLGIPTVFFSYDDLGGMLTSLRRLGDLLGTPEAAEAEAVRLEARIARLEARTARIEDRPLTLFLIGDETLYSFGSESYVHDLIALAGGRSATGDMAAQAPVLSEEFVLTHRPDVILGAWGDDYDPARLLDLHPTWRNVPALAEGRVHSLDPDLILRPGPRLVEGAWRMAALLHPEGFSTDSSQAASN